MIRLIFVLVSALVSLQVLAQEASTQGDTTPALQQLVSQLPNTKLNNMPALVDEIAKVNTPPSRLILQTILAGELYYIKSNKRVVKAIIDNEKHYQLTDLLSGDILTPVSKRKIKKIRSNNKLRSVIRAHMARMDLSSSDKASRLAAVKQILDKPSISGISAVESLVSNEGDAEVKALMNVVLHLEHLKAGAHSEKLAAVAYLSGSLQPAVKNAMASLKDELDSGAPSPEKRELQHALTHALEDIEAKRNVFNVAENIFFGLSLGSVLLLAAIGLAITFGVMGVINMAHGEMIMLGAYTTYVIQLLLPNFIEYSLLIAVPAAFLVSGLVGVVIERGVIRYLKGRPLETLLATFGISLILQQLVRTVFSPLNRQVQSPEWMTGSWQINPVFSITYSRLYIILFSLFVFVSLLMILRKTALGLHVRAVSQNREMARALSIRSDRVDAITFGLGSGVAGVAGVVLSQLTNVGPNLGQAYIIDSFLVVVFGGVGNLWGTFLAAMSLGAINKFLEPLTGSVLANIIVLIGLVLFIQKRPKGLFPQKGRAVD